VWKELLANGVRVGKERVRQLMAQHGIKAYTKRKFKATTNSAHALPVAPNLIERDFSQSSQRAKTSTTRAGSTDTL
jgi:putative transposase